MKFATALSAVILLGFSGSAQSQSCLNYWVNPRTGFEECLNNFRQPYNQKASSGYSSSNFSVSKFKISPDPEDPDGVVRVQGLLNNISSQVQEVDTVTVDLKHGNITIKSLKIEFSRQIAPGKSAILTGNVLKEDLDGVPLNQIQVLPVAVDYR